MTRRSFVLALAACGGGSFLRGARGKPPPEDEALLDDLSRRAFRFFWEHADPDTGIVRGRARTSGEPYPPERRDVGSTGDTGFGLTALCIGAHRGWVGRDAA